MSKKVSFELAFGDTSAAYARFGRALIACHATLSDSTIFGETVIAMVQMPVHEHAHFRDICKPWHMKYCSPMVFEHGTLIGMHASPEDEVAGNITRAAKGVIARSQRCVCNHLLADHAANLACSYGNCACASYCPELCQ